MPVDGRWDLSWRLNLMLLTWRIRWAPNNASRWQRGSNSAFIGLNSNIMYVSIQKNLKFSKLHSHSISASPPRDSKDVFSCPSSPQATCYCVAGYMWLASCRLASLQYRQPGGVCGPTFIRWHEGNRSCWNVFWTNFILKQTGCLKM